MTTMHPATSEELEKVAISVIAREMQGWYAEGKNLHEFEDDHAMNLLVEQGIRPSRLSRDLDQLIYLAHRQLMRSPNHV